MDRLSLDILFCDPEPDLIKFASNDCLPSRKILRDIENPSSFLNTINLKSNNKAIHATNS